MRRRFLCALASLAFCVSFPVAALSVRPLQLDEIIDASVLAFEGTCIGTESRRDPQTGWIVTLTTFTVDDVLKGAAGSTLTIKQIGGEDAREGVRQVVHGIPQFKPGESYVVFMPQASASGLSSPIGLEQGRYFVDGGAQQRQVGNGRDFKELTARMAPGALPSAASASMQASGPVLKLGLDAFKDLVRLRAGAPK
jgi:hypothetical protein